jgi:hypothetical protein
MLRLLVTEGQIQDRKTEACVTTVLFTPRRAGMECETPEPSHLFTPHNPIFIIRCVPPRDIANLTKSR